MDLPRKQPWQVNGASWSPTPKDAYVNKSLHEEYWYEKDSNGNTIYQNTKRRNINDSHLWRFETFGQLSLEEYNDIKLVFRSHGKRLGAYEQAKDRHPEELPLTEEELKLPIVKLLYAGTDAAVKNVFDKYGKVLINDYRAHDKVRTIFGETELEVGYFDNDHKEIAERNIRKGGCAATDYRGLRFQIVKCMNPHVSGFFIDWVDETLAKGGGFKEGKEFEWWTIPVRTFTSEELGWLCAVFPEAFQWVEEKLKLAAEIREAALNSPLHLEFAQGEYGYSESERTDLSLQAPTPKEYIHGILRSLDSSKSPTSSSSSDGWHHVVGLSDSVSDDSEKDEPLFGPSPPTVVDSRRGFCTVRR